MKRDSRTLLPRGKPGSFMAQLTELSDGYAAAAAVGGGGKGGRARRSSGTLGIKNERQTQMPSSGDADDDAEHGFHKHADDVPMDTQEHSGALFQLHAPFTAEVGSTFDSDQLAELEVLPPLSASGTVPPPFSLAGATMPSFSALSTHDPPPHAFGSHSSPGNVFDFSAHHGFAEQLKAEVSAHHAHAGMDGSSPWQSGGASGGHHDGHTALSARELRADWGSSFPDVLERLSRLDALQLEDKPDRAALERDVSGSFFIDDDVQTAQSGGDGSLIFADSGASSRERSWSSDTEQLRGEKVSKTRTKSQRKAPGPASRFCHVCARTQKASPHVTCSKFFQGECRKTVCQRCFELNEWDWESAARPDSNWICTHCRGCCPMHARCAIYERVNSRRRDRSVSKDNLRTSHRRTPSSSPVRGYISGDAPSSGIHRPSSARARRVRGSSGDSSLFDPLSAASYSPTTSPAPESGHVSSSSEL